MTWSQFLAEKEFQTGVETHHTSYPVSAWHFPEGSSSWSEAVYLPLFNTRVYNA